MSKNLEEQFFQRRQMKGKQVQKKNAHNTSHQENANKTSRRYHLMPIRMATSIKTSEKKCWWGCGEKELLYPVGRTVD